MINLKKISIAIGLIIFGILAYLFLLSPVSESLFNKATETTSGLTIIFPIFLLIHLILSILYVKRYSKKILLIMILLLFIQFAISNINFPDCDKYSKTGVKNSCECLGIKKSDLFNSECMGIRANCYNYTYELKNYTNSNNVTKSTFFPIKERVPCKI